jgi:hypothetical protein
MTFLASSRTEQLCWATVGIMLVAAVLTATVQLADKRLLDGVSIWAKPLKFELATAVHFATLGLVVAALGPAWRTGSLLWWVMLAAVVSALFEVGYIALQASRQEASHFNTGTPVRAALYSLMALGAVILTAAAGVVGFLALIDAEARMGMATRIGVGVGLIGGTVLTIIVGLTMGGSPGHHVGVEPAGAARMPITGWSLTVGDRRVPHFFATHMMQAVPVAGLLLDIIATRWIAVGGVTMFAAAWGGATWLSFERANAGLPFLAWR